MKTDEKGKLLHDDNPESFRYKGRTFIVDKLDDGYLITDSQFLAKERGDDFAEVKNRIEKRWDKLEVDYKDFL
tara:strand:+ start:36733 stop:36951 length:219 start_codon:yes stop_codon:yes gene_type:complete